MNVLHARIKNLLKSRERVALDFKSQLVFEIKELHYTNMDEMFLKKAIDTVNQHLDDSVFDQQQFSEEMNVSKSTLYNKLKTLTGLNTSAFITNIRMKRPAGSWTNTRASVSPSSLIAWGSMIPSISVPALRKSLICDRVSIWNGSQVRWNPDRHAFKFTEPQFHPE